MYIDATTCALLAFNFIVWPVAAYTLGRLKGISECRRALNKESK